MTFDEFDQLVIITWLNRGAGTNFLVHISLGHFSMYRVISAADWDDSDVRGGVELRKEAYQECIEWLETCQNKNG